MDLKLHIINAGSISLGPGPVGPGRSSVYTHKNTSVPARSRPGRVLSCFCHVRLTPVCAQRSLFSDVSTLTVISAAAYKRSNTNRALYSYIVIHVRASPPHGYIHCGHLICPGRLVSFSLPHASFMMLRVDR